MLAMILIVMMVGFMGCLIFAHGAGNVIKNRADGCTVDSWYVIEMIVGAAMFLIFYNVIH